jgi:glycosyltransferase involved in cell wall biosynthesis
MSGSAAAGRRENNTIRRRRILVVPSEYPDIRDPLKFHGNWAEEQTRALADYHDTAVVYPVVTMNGNQGIECLDYHRVPTFIVNYKHIRKTWVSPYVFALWKGIKQASARLQPECIHAHGIYPAGFAAVLVGDRLRVPVVITEHWGRLEERSAEGRLIRSVLKYALRRATRVIAVSRFLAEEIRRLEPRCAPDVVPNIVAPLFSGAAPVNRPRSKGDVQILFVGSIHDNRKGMDVLLPALKAYLDMPGARGCHLSVIGDGGKRAEFESLARGLGIHDRCSFLGNRSREEVAAAMAACDLFVMPSKYETFGVVYVEAMACGKPVIACSGGPAEEVVPGWAGEFVPPGDHVSLAQAIYRIASNLHDFDRTKISEYAKSKFGSETVVHDLTSVYERAIKTHSECR